MTTNIRKQVERSSLGTGSARAARRTVTAPAAAKVVARAAALRSSKTRSGG